MKFTLSAGLGLMLGMVLADAQTQPVKLAASARMDVNAEESVGALNEVYFVSGSGQVKHQDWRPAGEQPRTSTVSMPIVSFAWTEGAVQFVPQGSGLVTLKLLGPWEDVSGGKCFRQEVLWDALSAKGSTLKNGGFESATGNAADGWSFSYGDGGVTNVFPAEGFNVARVWHDGPVETTLAVTAGVPVTVRFSARAVFPAGFPQLARCGSNTPAHEALKHFLRGVNLSAHLDAPPNTWGNMVYTTNDFARIKAEGFDHVRLPVGWQFYTGPAPDYALTADIVSKVDFLVTNSLQAGLAVLLNIHNFDDFTTDPAGQSNRFQAIWKQVAAHYKGQPSGLAFELLNEPKDAATTTLMNSCFADAIREIRKTNPKRTIFVGPGKWNSLDEVSELRLPDDDLNLVVTVHCYEPFYFTHQGASWSLPDSATRGLVYPGPPPAPLDPDASLTNKAWIVDWFQRYNTLPTEQNPCSRLAFTSKYQTVKQWSEYYGRPVHLGEFGAYNVYGDVASRVRFCRDMRETAESSGFGWALWDWKATFGYWDDKTRQPHPGMREALFGK